MCHCDRLLAAANVPRAARPIAEIACLQSSQGQRIDECSASPNLVRLRASNFIAPRIVGRACREIPGLPATPPAGPKWSPPTASDTLWSAKATLDWERELHTFACGCLPKQDVEAAILARVKANGFTVDGIQHAVRETLLANQDCGLPSGWERRVEELPALARTLELRPVPGIGRALDVVQASGRQAWIVTKGSVLTQALKVARLECRSRFSVVEVVSAKTRRTYREVLQRHAVDPKDFMMVGDSFFQDVIPPVMLGCSATYIPAGKARVLRPMGMLARSSRLTLCASLEQACDAKLDA